MKRNQKRRVVDNSPRVTRSDHGNSSKANTNILYTPPIGKTGHGSNTSSGGDSALLQRLEKITNEINTMQTYPNQQNQPPNQNYPFQYNTQPHQHLQQQQQQQPQFSVPPGYPPSFMNASPRTMEYTNESSPQQMNEVIHNGYQQPQQSQQPQQYPQHALSPQRQMQQKPPFQQSDGSMQLQGAPTFSATSNQLVR